MKYEIVKNIFIQHAWNVEATDREGMVLVTIFCGQEALERAQEYVDMKTSLVAGRLRFAHRGRVQ